MKNIKKSILLIAILIATTSCVSTKSTLKNVDDNAPNLVLSRENTFIITEYSTDKKYGYDADYPANIFFQNTRNETVNQERFLNALAGPKGEKNNFFKTRKLLSFSNKENRLRCGIS